MSGKAQAGAAPAAGAQLYSFVEQACYNPDDSPRANRAPVAFRVFSIGKGLGTRVDVHFTSDYGVYYGDHAQLMAALAQAAPAVDWASGKVYYSWPDQSRIQVLDDATGKIVAQVETRRYFGRKVRGDAVEAGAYGQNVVTLDQLRVARMQRATQALAEQRTDGPDPEQDN